MVSVIDSRGSARANFTTRMENDRTRAASSSATEGTLPALHEPDQHKTGRNGGFLEQAYQKLPAESAHNFANPAKRRLRSSVKSSDPQILRSSDPQILRSSDSQILKLSWSNKTPSRDTSIRAPQGVHRA